MVYIAKNDREEIKEKINKDTAELVVVKDGGNLLNQLGTKNALVIGLIGSIMTVCTVGFVVLIWLVFR